MEMEFLVVMVIVYNLNLQFRKVVHVHANAQQIIKNIFSLKNIHINDTGYIF